MAIDGTYGIVYCGHAGLGVAVFTVTAIETVQGNIVVDLSQKVPPNVRLVGGIAPQEVPYSLTINEEVPPLFGDGEPLRLGTTTVMVKRIPDEYLTRPTSLWSRLLAGP